MSDPVARMYEILIVEEINRQHRAHLEDCGGMNITPLTAGALDVEAMARVLARPMSSAIQEALEPQAQPGIDVRASTAISLKRIADSIAPSQGLSINEILHALYHAASNRNG